MLVLKSYAHFKITFKLLGDSSHSVSPPPHTLFLISICVEAGTLSSLHQSAAWYSTARIVTFHLLILLVTGMGVPSNALLPSVLLAVDMLSCLFWACPVSLGDVSRCGVAEPEGLYLFTSTGKCCPAWGTSLSLITQRRRIPLCLHLCQCGLLLLLSENQ